LGDLHEKGKDLCLKSLFKAFHIGQILVGFGQEKVGANWGFYPSNYFAFSSSLLSQTRDLLYFFPLASPFPST